MADPLTTLRRITARRARLIAEVAAAEQDRDDEIRALIAAKTARAAEIATAAQLHVQRIYQIRDGRR